MKNFRKHPGGASIDIPVGERVYVRAYQFVFNRRVYPVLKWIGLCPAVNLFSRSFVLKLWRLEVNVGQKKQA